VTAPKITLNNTFHKQTLGDFRRRTLAGGGRKPLRTLSELAAEFGVTDKSLQASIIQDPEGPRPLYRTGGTVSSIMKTRRPISVWYDPDLVRAWWKKRLEKRNEQAK